MSASHLGNCNRIAKYKPIKERYIDMGLDVNGIRLMLYAKRLGANFQNVVTIGRQNLYLSQRQLFGQLSEFGFDCPGHFKFAYGDFCEPFFQILGARDIQSVDYSSFENATIIHDMNQPLPN